MRRAYVERALAFHPDRVAASDLEASRTAEFRMRELNAAWEVLRDPKRRAAYDRTLHHDREPSTTTVAPSTMVAPTAMPEPLGHPEQPPRGGPWWWLGPLLVLVVLVVGAVAAAVLQSGGQDPGGVDVQVGARYEPGMCVAVRPGPDAQIVSCDGPSSGRIVEVHPYPRPCTDGSLRAVALPAEDTTLCLEVAQQGRG